MGESSTIGGSTGVDGEAGELDSAQLDSDQLDSAQLDSVEPESAALSSVPFDPDAFEAAKAEFEAADAELALVRRKSAKRDRWHSRWATLASFVVILLIAGGMVGFTYYKAHHKPKFLVPQHVAKRQNGLLIAGSGPVAVDIYVDYACPTCGDFQSSVTGPLEQLASGNTITFVYHPLALLDAKSKTQYSTRAAAAVACASDLNALLPYANTLLTHQPTKSAGWSDDYLVLLGARIGMINPAFASCVRTGKYVKWIANQTAAAARKGVTKAPAVLVAGRAVSVPGTTPTMAQVTAAITARRTTR